MIDFIISLAILLFVGNAFQVLAYVILISIDTWTSITEMTDRDLRRFHFFCEDVRTQIRIETKAIDTYYSVLDLYEITHDDDVYELLRDIVYE